MEPEELYLRLRPVIQTMPDLRQESEELPKWLGEAAILVEVAGFLGDATTFTSLADDLLSKGSFFTRAADMIPVVLHRALAKAELSAPSALRDSFLPAGKPFDAMMIVVKVFATAKADLLAIDPYADHILLSDFLLAAPEGISIRILAAKRKLKPTLKPAVDRWIAQFGAARPLEVRVAPETALHDRLIILDGAVVWDIGQSFAQLATRSNTSSR